MVRHERLELPRRQARMAPESSVHVRLVAIARLQRDARQACRGVRESTDRLREGECAPQSWANGSPSIPKSLGASEPRGRRRVGCGGAASRVEFSMGRDFLTGALLLQGLDGYEPAVNPAGASSAQLAYLARVVC